MNHTADLFCVRLPWKTVFVCIYLNRSQHQRSLSCFSSSKAAQLGVVRGEEEEDLLCWCGLKHSSIFLVNSTQSSFLYKTYNLSLRWVEWYRGCSGLVSPCVLWSWLWGCGFTPAFTILLHKSDHLWWDFTSPFCTQTSTFSISVCKVRMCWSQETKSISTFGCPPQQVVAQCDPGHTCVHAAVRMWPHVALTTFECILGAFRPVLRVATSEPVSVPGLNSGKLRVLSVMDFTWHKPSTLNTLVDHAQA